jgi:hypothetical protein
MNYLRTLGSTAVIAVLGATVATGAGASTEVSPAGGHVISAKGPGHLRDVIDVLAADQGWLVYTRTNAGGGTAGSDNEPAFARNRSGEQRALGVLGKQPAGFTSPVSDYSVAGSTLTAINVTHPNALTIEIWDLATGSDTTVPYPTDGRYLGAVPGGFLYYDGAEDYEESSNGTVTDLGAAFFGTNPEATSATEYALAGSKYAVFSDDDGLVSSYDFATKTFRAVTVPQTTNRYVMICWAVIGAHAACDSNNNDDHKSNQENILSLTGGEPRYVTSAATSAPALGAEGMTWAAGGRLHTLTYGGKQRVGIAVDRGAEPVTAYNAVLITRDGNTEVSSTAGAGRPLHHVLTTPYAPVDLRGFALGGGRVAWLDDGGKAGAQRVLVANVSHGQVSDKHVVTTTPGIVAVGVSRSVIAYGATEKGKSGLRISARRHSRFIKGVVNPVVGVSGHDVLYFTGPTDRHATAKVYDTSTGVTTTVTSGIAWGRAETAAAISGQRVIYEKPGGSVWLDDLATHTVTELRTPGGIESESQVYLSGDHAAWSFPNQNEYRNVATMAPATDVPNDTIFGVTDHGLLIDNHPYRLMPFGGSPGPGFLNTTSNFTPQIVGTTIAWIEGQDRLLVADAATLTSR